jgi:rod shape-determining protein MreD
MKHFLLILLAYLLAMLQLGMRSWFPDLLLLLVVTVAVFEERNFAILVAFVAGLFLDLGNPGLLGANMLIYLVVGYGVILARRVVYEKISYAVVLCAGALVLKYALGFALAQTLPAWWELLVACGLTLLLLLPVHRLIKLLFGYRWKVA